MGQEGRKLKPERPTDSRRAQREKKTVAVMVGMYCRFHHGTPASRGNPSTRTNGGGLCPGCQELLTYARGKIDRCVFHDSKATCNRCRVHCYTRAMREEVRAVMRFSGPRMMRRHPLLAFMHLADGMRHRGGSRPERPMVDR